MIENNNKKGDLARLVKVIVGAFIISIGSFFMLEAFREGFTSPVDNDVAILAALGIPFILLGTVMFLKNTIELFQK